VVPVYLHGTRHVIGKSPETGSKPPGGSGTENRGHRSIRRSPVTVIFGPPLVPREGEDARRFSSRIEAEVAILADEARSDWWTARRQAAAGTSPSPRGPDASTWRRSWALGPAPGDEPRVAGEREWPRV